MTKFVRFVVAPWTNSENIIKIRWTHVPDSTNGRSNLELYFPCFIFLLIFLETLPRWHSRRKAFKLQETWNMTVNGCSLHITFTMDTRPPRYSLKDTVPATFLPHSFHHNAPAIRKNTMLWKIGPRSKFLFQMEIHEIWCWEWPGKLLARTHFFAVGSYDALNTVSVMLNK